MTITKIQTIRSTLNFTIDYDDMSELYQISKNYETYMIKELER